MKYLAACLLLCLSIGAWAESKPKLDLIRVVDKSQGLDTLFTSVVLEPENLYTDSLRVGVKLGEGKPITYVFDQAQIEFFRLKGTMYEPRLLQLEDGTEHRLLLERDRGGRNSNALVYTMGKGSQKRYFMRTRQDSTLHSLANTDGLFSSYTLDYLDSLWQEPSAKAADFAHKTRATRGHFRLAERIYHQHNDHYLRHFTWGVLAGVHRTDLTTVQQGELHGQWCATAGLWADLPVDSWGTSLRAEVNYYANSAMLEVPSTLTAYNYRGLDVPLLLRYTALPVRGRVMPYIEGGVALGVTLSSNLEAERKNWDQDGEYYYNYSGRCSSGMPVSLLYGAGVEWQLNPRHSLWLGLRYRMPALVEEYVLEMPENTEAHERSVKLKHSGITLTLMYNL